MLETQTDDSSHCRCTIYLTVFSSDTKRRAVLLQEFFVNTENAQRLLAASFQTIALLLPPINFARFSLKVVLSHSC